MGHFVVSQIFFFPNRQCSRDHSSTDLAPPLSSSFLVLQGPRASQISLTFHVLVPAHKMDPAGLSDRLPPLLLPCRLFLQPPFSCPVVLRDTWSYRTAPPITIADLHGFSTAHGQPEPSLYTQWASFFGPDLSSYDYFFYYSSVIQVTSWVLSDMFSFYRLFQFC